MILLTSNSNVLACLKQQFRCLMSRPCKILQGIPGYCRRSMAALLADCICTEPHNAGLDAEHSIMTADDAVLDCCLLSTLELLVNAQPVGYNKAPFCVHNTIQVLLAGCVQDSRSSQAVVW